MVLPAWVIVIVKFIVAIVVEPGMGIVVMAVRVTALWLQKFLQLGWLRRACMVLNGKNSLWL